MTKEENLREKFEAWIVKTHTESAKVLGLMETIEHLKLIYKVNKYLIRKFKNFDEYLDEDTQLQWIAYKAAYADCEAEFEQVGYQLVPIEPTEDMEYFGNDIGDQLAMAINGENYNYDMDTANKVYKAMLQAAPKIKD